MVTKKMRTLEITNDNKPFKKQNIGNKGNMQETASACNVPKSSASRENAIVVRNLGTISQLNCKNLKAKQEKKVIFFW